jgi:DNA-directed RNA polymerase
MSTYNDRLNVRLEQAQVDLEQQARCSSRGRQEATRDERPVWDRSHPKSIETAVGAVTEAIQAWIDDHSQGKPGRPPKALEALRTIRAERAAHIGLIACLALEPQDRSLGTAIIKIGHDIERELDLERLVQQNEKLARKLFKRIDKEYPGSEELQLWALRKMATGGLYEPELGWTNDERSDVGSEVLAAIIHKSGLFEAVESAKKREYRQGKASWKKSTQLQLGFTEKAMAARKELAEHSYMFHPPMVVMPQQWPQKPYRTTALNRDLQPVRNTSNDQRAILRERHRAGDLDRFYAALNRLQNVPYTINTRVLNVLTALWEADPYVRVSKMPRVPFKVPLKL